MGGIGALAFCILASLALHVCGFFASTPSRLAGDGAKKAAHSSPKSPARTEIDIEVLPLPAHSAPAVATADNGSWALTTAKPAVAPVAPPKPKRTSKPKAPSPSMPGDVFDSAGARVAGVVHASQNADDQFIDCSPKAVAEYERTVAESADGYWSFAVKLDAEQRVFVCRVSQRFKDDPHAIFLARLGIRLTNLGKSYVQSRKKLFSSNHAPLCPEFQKELRNFLSDLDAFHAKGIETPSSFEALREDFQREADRLGYADSDSPEEQERKCNESWLMFDQAFVNNIEPEMIKKIGPDLCAWRKDIEKFEVVGSTVTRTGSTARFPKILNDCDGLNEAPEGELPLLPPGRSRSTTQVHR